MLFEAVGKQKLSYKLKIHAGNLTGFRYRPERLVKYLDCQRLTQD